MSRTRDETPSRAVRKGAIMLEWKESYSTGNADVDAQHRQLFEMVNKFETAVRGGTAEANVTKTLQFLQRYVRHHFTYEEDCMKRAHCAAAEENRREHAEFLASYQGFARRFVSEGYSDALAMEMLITMQTWLIHHICGVDVRLKFNVVHA